jgi:EpsI family protein
MAAHVEDLERAAAHRLAFTPFVVACLLLIVGVVGLWPSWRALGQLWLASADYQHGFIVAGVSIVWALRSRRVIDTVRSRPMPGLLPLLALMLACWVVAYRGNSQLLQQVLLPAILLAAVTTALGAQVGRVLAPPIAFLYFVIPVWDQLLPLLQGLTTVVAEQTLGLLQVPTVVDGNDVTIPEGRFTIADACSGKRYLIVGLAFSVIAGVAQGLRRQRLVVLMAIAVLLALLVNWLRVVTIIYAGHVSNMQHYLVAKEHLTFGWLVFIPLLAGLILSARRLARSGSPQPSAPNASPVQRVATTSWIASFVLLGAPVVLVVADTRSGAPEPGLAQLPVMTGAWQGPLPTRDQWQPRYQGAAAERRGRYSGVDGDIEVYLNVYGAQRQGHELIYFENSVTPPGEWSAAGQPSLQDSALTVFVAKRIGTGEKWVMAQSYRIGGKSTMTPAVAQLYYGMQAIWRPVPAGTMAVAAPCTLDCESAALRVRAFWRDHGLVLAALIPARF